MTPPFDLTGSKALITGAGSPTGIGIRAVSKFIPKITSYYNEIKEQEKCIMFFDLDPGLPNYSSKIISIEGYVVYFRF